VPPPPAVSGTSPTLPNRTNPARADEYRRQTARLREAIRPIAALDLESWNRLPKAERIIQLPVEDWREIVEAYRAMGSPPILFTVDEVMMMFRNLGIDVECGTCMAIAFTGYGTGEHTCQKK